LDGHQIGRVTIGSALSECGCADPDCDLAGFPVTVQEIPNDVLQAASKNLAGYVAKTTSGVEAARQKVRFSTVNSAPAGVSRASGGQFNAA
jgi:hypothetical protein